MQSCPLNSRNCGSGALEPGLQQLPPKSDGSHNSQEEGEAYGEGLLGGLAKTKLPSRIASDQRYRPELLGTGLAVLIVDFIDNLSVRYFGCPLLPGPES